MNRLFTYERLPQGKKVIPAVLATLLLVACAVEWGLAQGDAVGYEEIPLDPIFMKTDEKSGEVVVNDAIVKKAALKKGQIVTGVAPLADETNARAFDLYYTGYTLRVFSHVNSLNKLPERRKELIDDLRRSGAKKDVHDRLLTSTDRYMRGYVTSTKNFHPAVRFNAMLVLGDLNSEESGVIVAGQTGPTKYPNPKADVFDFLVTEFKKPNQTYALKLASLLGIMRHCQMDWARPVAARIPAAKKQEVAQLMTDLLKVKDPPNPSDRDGHIWLQRRAIDTLAAMGMVGESDAVNQQLSSLVQDHKADLSLRVSAAEAMGRIPEKAKSKFDANKESIHLATLLVVACRREIERIDNAIRKRMMFGGGGGMGMPGGMPGSEGMGMPGMGGMPGGMPGMADAAGGMGMPGMGGMPGGMPGMADAAGGMGMPGGMPGMGGMPGGMPGMADAAGGMGMPGMGMPGAEGMAGMGGMGGMTGVPKDPVTELFRRQLKYEIEAVRRGLVGVGRSNPQKDAKAKTPFNDLKKEVDEIFNATDPPQYMPVMTLDVLRKSVTDKLKPLEKRTAAYLPKDLKTPAPELPVADTAEAGGKKGAAAPAGKAPPAGKSAPAAAPGTAPAPAAKGAAAPAAAPATPPANAPPAAAPAAKGAAPAKAG